MAQENKLTLENLMEGMIYMLRPRNNENVELNEFTVLNTVLSADDNFTKPQSSMNLFKGDVYWIVWANGGKKVKFPHNWMELSVRGLAEHIMSKQ